MRLGKFLLTMGLVTTVALTYIHMQMQIIDLAYQGNQKEQRIRHLIEENGDATYKILMLKSANHIGASMLEENSDMKFADTENIIRITTSKAFLLDNQLNESAELARKTKPLLSLLSFGVVAEARTSE